MKHRKYETTIVKFEIVSSSFFIRKHIKFDFNGQYISKLHSLITKYKNFIFNLN